MISASLLARASEVTAVQGSFYTVKSGDRLWMVALSAYSDQWKYGKIVGANPQLGGRKLADDGSPVIFAGDRLWVPSLVDDESVQTGKSFADQQSKSFSVVVNGEAVAVTSGEYLEAFDTGCDQLTFSVDPMTLSGKVKDALKPFRYAKVQLLIMGELRFTGYCYEIETSLEAEKLEKKIVAYSLTAELIDSVVNPPLEQAGVTLKQRAEKLCSDFGIGVVMNGADKKFVKCTAEDTEKRWDHLKKLAHDRGMVMTCDGQGRAVFTKASTGGEPIAYIEEGGKLATSFSMKSDGRNRFSHYRISGKKKTSKDTLTGEKSKSGATYTVIDKNMPINRYFYSKDQGSDSDDVTDRAEFERSKAIADSLTFTVPVSSWFDKNGNVWRTNRFVSIKSPSVDLNTAVSLLIRRATIIFSTDGNTASLDLVPKEVFTGEDVPDIFA